jgi:putative transposase
MSHRSQQIKKWNLNEPGNIICRFVLQSKEQGYLTSGDFFILDNASAHCSQGILDMMYDLLKAANVRLVFLPKYSPEKNPCEKCFNFIKGQLRHYRGDSCPLWMEIAMAVAQIEPHHLFKFYQKCIQS